MDKKPVTKQRKYGIPFVAFLCLLFMAAAIVLYFVTGEEYVSYYYEDDRDLTLVSTSPSETGGASQDSAIILEWNRPVSIDVADEVILTPSARGKWSVFGNKLIFTPQQLAAGTYYTVSIPKGTWLNQRGDVLEEDVFFSFETEDPDIRVPSEEAFSVDGRSFTFSNDETVSIPVSLVSEKDSTVDVSVYRAENADAFVEAFGELFAYPSWAQLSIGEFQAEEWDFDKVSASEMAVRTDEDSSFVNLGSLPEGQYLVRLDAAGQSYDVAVTVSDLRLGMVYDHGVLSLMAIRVGKADAKPVTDGKVTLAGTTVSLDENGFASVDHPFDLRKIHEDPSALAAYLTADSEEIVSFLSADDVTPSYDGDLFLDQPNIEGGGALQASGAVFSCIGVPMEGTATLLLCSSVGVLANSEVTLEKGYFSHQWENLAFADGEYRIVLYYDGLSLATDTVTFGGQKYELNLSVTPDSDSILSGESVTYIARVTDQTGAPIDNAAVSLNGGEAVSVDRNGEAVFRETYFVAKGLSSVQKNAEFRVASPYGNAAAVTTSVSVRHSSPVPSSDKGEKTSAVTNSGLPLLLNEGAFAVAEEEETPSYSMAYHKTDHTFALEPVVEPLSFTVPADISVATGDTVAFAASANGSSRRITSVSLYKGRVPDELCGRNIYSESFYEQFYGTLEESRVFFGSDAIEAAFSTENRDGDYFIRLAAKDLQGAIVSCYVPVTISGVSLRCPDTSTYAAGHHVRLPFFVEGGEELDYRLTIGERVYQGTAAEDFSVVTDITDAGQYDGKMEIRKEDSIVASKSFHFSVYEKQPMFYRVQEGKADNAFAVCRVKKDDADAFLTMFEMIALPGDQILHRMGKTLFYQAFGETAPGDHSALNVDLMSLQKSDGGFSRFEYGESDLLLSVLVAEQQGFSCDRDSLCTYLKYRLTTADNPETAALACWGLSCFGYDCLESMVMIKDNGGNNDRSRLYLAEGYAAAGNREAALGLYKTLKRELKEKENGLCMGDADDQYDVANTAFMLDLAQKLNQPEAEGLFDFLMHTKIENQTGRYLLLFCMVKDVAAESIVAGNETGSDDDTTLLSFVAEDAADAPALATIFTQNGEMITAMDSGDMAEITLNWETTNNSIYLVYIKAPKGVSVVEKNGITAKQGYYEWITDGGVASVSFRADEVGKGVAPEIYVLNLTTGELVGRADVNDWKVKK